MKINYERDNLLTDYAVGMLKQRYMLPTEISPQEAFMRASRAFADNNEHAQRLYDYASQHWFMFATPILSNGGTKRGLPISCFLNSVGDSRQEIMDTFTENAFLASNGGGIGTGWSKVRSNGARTSRGSSSTGLIPFIKMQDSQTLAFSQGDTRRGSAAAWLHISHPEIEEFLDMRKPSGDANRKSLNMHHGVVIPDSFMRLIKRRETDRNFDDSWDLIDPDNGLVVKTVSARVIWAKILQNRIQTGEPYLMFEDTVNDALPDFQKRLGLKVTQSNLCSEITLATDENRTAVCCLSSVNAEKYDEWKDHPTFLEDLFRMLDNVLTVFIKTAPPEMYKAVYSAQRERAVGLGLMGWHAALQQRMIPFESEAAAKLNVEIFAHLRGGADKASKKLAIERGECPDAKGYGERFSHKLAPAPNASSSFICGDTSAGTDALPANYYTKKTLSGSVAFKNPRLVKLLESKNLNTERVWRSIAAEQGSVQHLSELTELEKAVFKTAWEIDQHWAIKHAADRAGFICQSQSINLYFPADVDKKHLHKVHMRAWEEEVKTLYYIRSMALRRGETIQRDEKVRANIFAAVNEEECVACEA